MPLKLANFVKVLCQSSPSYLLHYLLRFILHAMISFWRGCMAYSKYCLDGKYHLNLWIRFLPEPNHLFYFGTFKYWFFSSTVSIGDIPFIFFWHITHNVHWVLLLPVVSFSLYNSAVVFDLSFLRFLCFRLRFWVHIGSVPSHSFSEEYDSSITGFFIT